MAVVSEKCALYLTRFSWRQTDPVSDFRQGAWEIAVVTDENLNAQLSEKGPRYGLERGHLGLLLVGREVTALRLTGSFSGFPW